MVTFQQYNDALCYGAGGAYFSPLETKLLQSYWYEMVKYYCPLVVEVYGPHAEPLREDDQLEASLPEAIQLANRLAPLCGSIAKIYYDRPNTKAPHPEVNNPANNAYYEAEGNLSAWMQACHRFQALYNAAWEEV